MSDLRIRDNETICIRGVTYNLVYSMAVVDAIIDRFGSLTAMEEWQAAPERTDRETMDLTLWIMMLIINEDIAERNENGEQLKPYTVERLKRELPVRGFVDIKRKIFAVSVRDLPTAESDSVKN